MKWWMYIKAGWTEQDGEFVSEVATFLRHSDAVRYMEEEIRSCLDDDEKIWFVDRRNDSGVGVQSVVLWHEGAMNEFVVEIREMETPDPQHGGIMGMMACM